MDLAVAADHPAFAGHFPGEPLLPGVALLAEVVEAALADAELAAALGPTPRLGVAKFLAPVRPGAALTLRFDVTATALRFELTLAGAGAGTGAAARVAASGHFELAAPRDADSGADPGPVD